MKRYSSVFLVGLLLVTLLIGASTVYPVRGQGETSTFTATMTSTLVSMSLWSQMQLYAYGGQTYGQIINSQFHDADWVSGMSSQRQVTIHNAAPLGLSNVTQLCVMYDYTYGTMAGNTDILWLYLDGLMEVPEYNWNYIAEVEGSNQIECWTHSGGGWATITNVLVGVQVDNDTAENIGLLSGEAIIKGIWVDGPTLPTPTLTPSATYTPVTPSPTSEMAAFAPTWDERPMCTLTPAETATPSSTVGYNPFVDDLNDWGDTLRTALASAVTGTQWQYTPMVTNTQWAPYGTLTATPVRSVTPTAIGGCRAVPAWGSGPPAMDVGFAYITGTAGTPFEQCVNVFPDVHVYIGDIPMGIINGAFTTPVIDATNRNVNVDGLSICAKYRKFNATVAGQDWTPYLAALMAIAIAGYILYTIRGEL